MTYFPENFHRYNRLPVRRQAVVTGMGAVSAAGVGTQQLWDALMDGRSCVSVLSRLKNDELGINVAGEVKDFDAARHIEAWQRPKRMARQTQFAVAAAREALADAGLTVDDLRGRRVAVVIGSAASTLEMVEEVALQIDKGGPRRVAPTSILGGNLQAAPVAVAEMLKLDDINVLGFANNCTSGVDAIGVAVDLIRLGRYDLVVAGGAEAPLSSTVVSGISASGICTNSRRPDEASRPFDRDREGGVLAEGAGVVILEEKHFARERGGREVLEIFGTHTCPDLKRDRPSSGLEFTMRGALENAACDQGDIDYISAWGCGHPVFDRCETDAIKAAFGDQAYRVAVGSIKGTIGIPLAASGPLQLIVAGFAHRHGIVPPTVNWTRPDLDCDLDYIGRHPRRMKLRKTIINAHGLSGGNISLVVGAAEP